MGRHATWIASLLVGCGFQVPTSNQEPADAAGGGVIDGPPDVAMCVGPDTDGDGTVDACDPCPHDAPDDPDGDGICTSEDACPQGDDGADADADGVADACDDWPCGAKPAAPPSTVTWISGLESVTVSAVNLAGQGRLVVAMPGQSLELVAAYSIIDCQCTNCVDQIEVGFVPGGKQGCIYNGNPQGNSTSTTCLVPTAGTNDLELTAPTTPGVYPVRFRRGNANACQGNNTWWDNVEPGPGETIAIVCIH